MIDCSFGKISVIEVKDLPNGECRIEFEIDDTFKENFKKMYGLKRMSRKAFSRFVLEALSSALGEVEDA